jgi:hypothetical protein
MSNNKPPDKESAYLSPLLVPALAVSICMLAAGKIQETGKTGLIAYIIVTVLSLIWTVLNLNAIANVVKRFNIKINFIKSVFVTYTLALIVLGIIIIYAIIRLYSI